MRLTEHDIILMPATRKAKSFKKRKISTNTNTLSSSISLLSAMLSSWDEITTFLSSLSSSSRSTRNKLNVLKISRVNESRFVVRRYTGSRLGGGGGGWYKGEEPRENVRKGSREWGKEKWVGGERKEGRRDRRKKEEEEGNTKANKKNGKRRKEVNQGVRKRRNEVGITSEEGREEDRKRVRGLLQGGQEVKTMKWVNKKERTDPLTHRTMTSTWEEDRKRVRGLLQGGQEVKTMKWVNKKERTDPLTHRTMTSTWYKNLLKFCSKNFSVNCEMDSIGSVSAGIRAGLWPTCTVSATDTVGVTSWTTLSLPSLAFCSASRSNSPVSWLRCCFPNRCSFLLCRELKNWLQTLQYSSFVSSS